MSEVALVRRQRAFARPWTDAPWAIVGVGIALRAAIAYFSIGTNDAFLWHQFGYSALRGGFHSMWSRTLWMNHPPLPLLWAMIAYAAAPTSYPFSLLMKIPAVAGDLLSMLLVWRIVRERTGDDARARVATSLFALSPTAVLISGYHCNVDPLMAALVLLAAWLADRGRFGAAGLALGAAINVKVAPAPTVFLLLALAPTWRDAYRAARGLAVGALPFAYMLIAAGRPFVTNVFGYRPILPPWLVDPPYAFAALAGLRPLSIRAEALHRATALAVTFALVVGLIALGRRRGRPRDFVLLSATYWSAFVLWNGSAFQYVVWPLPLLAVVRPRLAIAFGVGAGVWLATSYCDALVPNITHLASVFDGAHPVEGRQTSVLPIACLVVIVASLAHELLRRNDAAPAYNRPSPEEPTMQPMRPMMPMEPMRPMEPIQMPPAWWPAGYGAANAAGGQDDVRYAYFGDKRRLIVDVGDGPRAYDTGEHRITGIQQSQGGRSRLVFSSDDGPIALEGLAAVALET